MEILAALGRFILSDIETLIKILFLGNFFFSAVVGIYCLSVTVELDRKRARTLMVAKLFQSFGWMGLYFMRYVPVFVSQNLGQSCLYTGLFLESLVMLDIVGFRARVLSRVQAIIYVAVVIGFNVVTLSHPNFLVRVAFGAYSLFFIMLIPAVSFLVRAGHSPLRRLTGSLYVFLFLACVFRAIQTLMAISGSGMPYGSLLTDVTLLLFVFHLHIGGIAFLLVLKEDTDRKLAELAFRDPLTGLYNRRHFLEHARSAIAQAIRSREEVSVLFMDLDFFKGVNDRYGHNFGDEVLRDFASVIRMHVRTCDIPCRYGGEEFVVFLPNAGRDGAFAAAERIRAYLRAAKFPNMPDFSYTVSVGIAFRVPGEKAQAVDVMHALIMDSDAALYRAKEGGRDRVVVFGEL
jgi:diguanylate cyclase (GGDEF)-like protein